MILAVGAQHVLIRTERFAQVQLRDQFVKCRRRAEHFTQHLGGQLLRLRAIGQGCGGLRLGRESAQGEREEDYKRQRSSHVRNSSQ